MLKTLDSNNDNLISASDAAFVSLLVWRDLNGNGYSEAGELQSLTAAGITSINLNYTALSNVKNQGHDVSSQSMASFADSSTTKIQDIWFRHNQANSFRVVPEGFACNPDVYVLPQLRAG